MGQNPERQLDQHKAQQLVIDEMNFLGLRYELEAFGDSIQTYLCYLIDKNGNSLTDGCGKGVGLQSQLSAMYESLEHYVTEFQFARIDHVRKNCRLIEVSTLFSTPRILDERPIALLRDHCQGQKIMCREYESLSSADSILYPVFLSFPNYAKHPLPEDVFDYRKIDRYTTNNGTAIGATKTEAAIHGLCERIERDAEAMFLIDTFVSKDTRKLRVISYKTLTPRLQNLVELINNSSGDEVIIIDATTDFGIPVFCAVLAQQNHIVKPYGFGCSLSAEYAIERALLEALQLYHMYGADSIEDYSMAIAQFNGLPTYLNCLTFDLSPIMEAGHYTETALASFLSIEIPTDLDVYLQTLVNRVKTNGYETYFATNYISSSGITCLNVLIPGLEHFHLVTTGNAVSMGFRGRKRMEDATSIQFI